jgi:hypothetical protein
MKDWNVCFHRWNASLYSLWFFLSWKMPWEWIDVAIYCLIPTVTDQPTSSLPWTRFFKFSCCSLVVERIASLIFLLRLLSVWLLFYRYYRSFVSIIVIVNTSWIKQFIRPKAVRVVCVVLRQRSLKILNVSDGGLSTAASRMCVSRKSNWSRSNEWHS